MISPFRRGSAPSAQQFFNAEKARHRHPRLWDREQYFDFAQRYADFVVQFEKCDGDLMLCDLWPGGDAASRVTSGIN